MDGDDCVFWFQLFKMEDVKGEDPVAISQMFNVTLRNDDDNDMSDGTGSGGLSAGVGAGIAVGAIAGALLLAGLGFFWKRSRNGKDGAAYQQTTENYVDQQPIQQKQVAYPQSYQLSSSPASQATAKPELSSEARVHEAP